MKIIDRRFVPLLSTFAVCGLAACGGEAEPGALCASTPVTSVRVTAESVKAAPANEPLMLDLRVPDRRYVIDESLQVADYQRIRLVSADGETVGLDRWIAPLRESQRRRGLSARTVELTSVTNTGDGVDTRACEVAARKQAVGGGDYQPVESGSCEGWKCWSFGRLGTWCCWFDDGCEVVYCENYFFGL